MAIPGKETNQRSQRRDCCLWAASGQLQEESPGRPVHNVIGGCRNPEGFGGCAGAGVGGVSWPPRRVKSCQAGLLMAGLLELVPNCAASLFGTEILVCAG